MYVLVPATWTILAADVKPWNLDAGLSYLVKGPALRLLATYSHNDFGATTSNAIQLGAQAIFF